MLHEPPSSTSKLTAPSPDPPDDDNSARPPGSSSSADTCVTSAAGVADVTVNDRASCAAAHRASPSCTAVSVQVPVRCSVTSPPATVHTAVVAEANDTVNPDVDDAVTLKVAADHVRSAGATNVMVCGSSTTANERTTGAAADQYALPACVAVSEHVPPATRVTTPVRTVHTAAVVLATDTVSPDDAAGVMATVPVEYAVDGTVANVIACAPLPTVTAAFPLLARMKLPPE